MAYNDGNPHTDFYLKSQEELEKIATEFSEGNNLLKETLLTLWRKGIKTKGCCNGHPERKNPCSYISIYFENNPTFTNELLDRIMELGSDDVEIDFLTDIAREKDMIMTIYIKSELRDFILNIIKETCKKELQPNTSDILECLRFLKPVCYASKLNCRLGLTHKEMQFGIHYPGYLIMLDETNPQLDDILAGFANEGKIPLGGYKCDLKTLKKFLSIIYPKEAYFKLEAKEQIK